MSRACIIARIRRALVLHWLDSTKILISISWGILWSCICPFFATLHNAYRNSTLFVIFIYLVLCLGHGFRLVAYIWNIWKGFYLSTGPYQQVQYREFYLIAWKFNSKWLLLPLYYHQLIHIIQQGYWCDLPDTMNSMDVFLTYVM